MFYTKQEIDRINASRSAEQGKKYYQDNGIVWEGTYTKQLRVISGPTPLPEGAATETTLEERTSPSDVQLVDGSAHVQPISVANLPLPSGASTESKQTETNSKLDSIIETLNTSNSDSQNIELKSYNQIELLSLIYEELQLQTKLLKKIYQ